MFDVIYRCALSKKSGRLYHCIVVNLGYTEKYLTFNVADIAEILGCPVAELAGANSPCERKIGIIGIDE